jgi:hypothetical protein
LQSGKTDLSTASFALGFIEDNALFLMPVDEAMQLRPSCSHVDAAREASAATRRGAAAAADDMEEDRKPSAPQLVPVTVQVRRRETEQQQEARLRSFAHLAALEASEEWVPLQRAPPGSKQALKALRRITGMMEAAGVERTLEREEYLAALVPGASSLEARQQEAAAAEAAGRPLDLGVPAAGPSSITVATAAVAAADAAALSPAARLALPRLLRTFFFSAPVLNLGNIRKILSKYKGELDLRPAAEGLSDAGLHAALMAGANITCIRSCYFPKNAGNPTVDPLRQAMAFFSFLARCFCRFLSFFYYI